MGAKTRLAVLGTGLMGRPMAERLLEAGYPVAVWNRSPEKAEPLAAAGATVAASVAEAMASADGIITMLSDAAAVREVVLGEVARSLLEGRTVIQMSTIGPHESLEIGAEVASLGGSVLEAPVLGSTPQASSGSLVVLAGGEAPLFEQWLPVLRCFGPEPRLIGPLGHAATLKLAMNQLTASLMTAYATSLAMARHAGIDLDAYAATVRAGAMYAPVFDKKLDRLLRMDFGQANFPLRLLLKDLRLAQSELERHDIAGDAVAGITSLLEQAMQRGLGDADYSAVAAVLDPRR